VFDNFLLLIPCVFFGNLAGYVLFVISPRFLILILFTITLAFFIYIVFTKTFEKFMIESEIIRKEEKEKQIEEEKAQQQITETKENEFHSFYNEKNIFII